MSMRWKVALLWLLILLVQETGALEPAKVTRHGPQLHHSVPTTSRPTARRIVALQPPDPPIEPPKLPLPTFCWRNLLILAANPAATVPVPLIAWVCKIQLGGPAFSLAPSEWVLSAQLVAPLLALSLLPLEKIPRLSSLAEVTRASKTISLYAFGTHLAPLRTLVAGTILAASAAVFEELAFRGALMGATQKLLAVCSLSPRLAVGGAICTQALVFGVLHSYTASRAYFIAATVAGAAFGGAFAWSRNLAVPVLMHFVLDLVAFGFCHVQVSRASEAEQRGLLDDPSPIARALRLTFAPPAREVEASQLEAVVSAPGVPPRPPDGGSA